MDQRVRVTVRSTEFGEPNPQLDGPSTYRYASCEVSDHRDDGRLFATRVELLDIDQSSPRPTVRLIVGLHNASSYGGVETTIGVDALYALAAAADELRVLFERLYPGLARAAKEEIHSIRAQLAEERPKLGRLAAPDPGEPDESDEPEPTSSENEGAR